MTPVRSTQHRAAKSKFYRPQLDVLRFFAFFCVYWFHSFRPVDWQGYMPEAALNAATIVANATGYGLSLFFFLSSYLITSLLLLEREESGTVNLRNFYVRRVLRIWPLYFLYIGAVALIGLHLKTWHLSVDRLLAMVFLAGNWYVIVAGFGGAGTAALWSISVEEQFYAIWPGVFRSVSRRAFILFTIVLAASSLVATFVFARHQASNVTIWLSSFSEAIFFAGGGLLAFYLPVRSIENTWRSIGLILAGLGSWVCAELLGHVSDRKADVAALRITPAYLLIAVGCGLLVVGFLSMRAERMPSWLVYLGKISYGLYVFHGFAMHAYGFFLGDRFHHGGEILINFAATVLLASLSYRFLEKPFLRLKAKFEVVKTRPA